MSAKPAVRFIFLTLLLDVMGFGLLIPVAPRLVEQLMGLPPGTDPSQVDAQAAPIVGWLMATYAICQFVFAPMLGTLSDHFGRRPVILFALAGSAIDYFAGALAPTLTLLFITRAINGLTGANIAACQAYVADVTPPDKRAAGYGMIGAAFGLGFIIGPVVGGMLGAIDIRLPYWFAGGLTVANVAYGYFVLPESLPPERRRPVSLLKANPFGVFVHLTRYPTVMWLGATSFVLSLGMYALHATWVLYTKHRYGWGETATGLSLTVVGVGAAIVQGGLAGRIIKRVGEPKALLAGLALAVLAYAGYGMATEGWMIYGIVAIASIGGIAGPASQAMITKSVPPTEQGEVQGALSAVGNIALVIGSPAGAAIFAYFISDRAPAYVPGASMYFSALCALLGLGVAAYALRVIRRLGPPVPQAAPTRDAQTPA